MRGHKRLRLFLQARRSGASVEDAALAADMSVREAELHDEIEQAGNYADIRVNLTRRGDNSEAANELRAFVERVEQLNEEMKGLREDKKIVLAEAEAKGYDKSAIGTVIKLREMDPSERAEADTIVELYRDALGID